MGELLVVGRILTLDPAQPIVDALLAREDRIVAVGSLKAIEAAASDEVERYVVPHGCVAMPAFEDPHLHLLAMAAARLSVDCSAEVCPSIEAVLRSIQQAAGVGDGWIRGWGFDEALVSGRRFPTVDELDQVTSARPLVLHHRTGHAALLNSAAIDILGAPAHVLDDRSRPLLDNVPRLAHDEMVGAVGTVSTDLLAAGVVRITDASHTNGPEELEFLARLCAEGIIQQQVTAMVGGGALASVRHGGKIGSVTVGWAKIMPLPGRHDEVADQVAHAREHDYPVAIHVTDVDELEVALEALERSPSAPYRSGFMYVDRLEHVGLALPEQVQRIAALDVSVVTQPSFVTHRVDKYRVELSAVEHDWLYRSRSLLDAGIEVLAGSDAPVVSGRPLDAAHAAVTRELGPTERVDVGSALRMVTGGTSLRAGAPAAVVVLDNDPFGEPRNFDKGSLDQIQVVDVLHGVSPVRLSQGTPPG